MSTDVCSATMMQYGHRCWELRSLLLKHFALYNRNSRVLSGHWHPDTVNCLGYRVKQRLPRLALEWVIILICQFLMKAFQMRGF